MRGRRATCTLLVFVGSLLLSTVGSATALERTGAQGTASHDASDHIDWRPCTADEMGHPTEDFLRQMQCAYVTVPVDYAHPHGRTLRLFVSRRPSTASDPLGPLFVNQGGPGAEAAIFAMAMGASPAFARFDVIGMDPRGVGRSTNLHCTSSIGAVPAVQVGTDEPSPFERAVQKFAESCAGDPNLPHLGSNNAARDMNRIRELLGAPQISYFGKSYGSDLGTAFVSQFPDRVRAAVFDGATDLTLDPVDFIAQQQRASARAFDAYLAHCLAAQCAWAKGEDPATAWAALLRRLDQDPRHDAQSGTRITGDTLRDFAGKVIELSPTDVDGALDALVLHGDASALVEPPLTHEAERLATAFFAITCQDLPIDHFRPALARLRDAVPDPRPDAVMTLATCAAWPKPGDPIRVKQLPPSAKVMVVSTRGDVPTPYESGVGLARALSVPLLTFDGGTHTAYLVSPCVAQHANALLVDLTQLPPDGATCPDDRTNADVPLDEPDLDPR